MPLENVFPAVGFFQRKILNRIEVLAAAVGFSGGRAGCAHRRIFSLLQFMGLSMLKCLGSRGWRVEAPSNQAHTDPRISPERPVITKGLPVGIAISHGRHSGWSTDTHSFPNADLVSLVAHLRILDIHSTTETF